MNFQEKLIETTADLRTRAAALASVAATARARAGVAVNVLTVAGRQFGKVARRHVVRFVKENATIAADARNDVSTLARTTYVTLAKRTAAPRKTRKAPAARKQAARKAA